MNQVNLFIEKAITKAAAILCLALLLLAAGCNQSSSQDLNFTLEELERLNTVDAVFAKHSSVRTESKYYDFERPEGGRGDFTQTTVYKDNATMYTEFSFGYAYAIENGNVYFRDYDGTYGMNAFFDDGFFEEYYLPYITKWILYTPTDGEEIFSVAEEDGIRKVITRRDSAAEEDFEFWGIDGVIETVYELDAETGLLLRDTSYLINGDNRKLLGESEVVYGNDSGFPAPEYVVPDMSDARIVRYIRDHGTPEEKTFTFTVARNAVLSPSTIEAYEYYADQEFTVLYEDTPGDYPDELTLYMRKV